MGVPGHGVSPGVGTAKVGELTLPQAAQPTCLPFPDLSKRSFSLIPPSSQGELLCLHMNSSPSQPSLQTPSTNLLAHCHLKLPDHDYAMDQASEKWDSGNRGGRYLWIPSRRCLCVCDSRTLPPQAACVAEGTAQAWPQLSPPHPQI